MKAKLWGARFKKSMDPDFEKFSSSLEWDIRLLPYDLAIDAAHVKALGRAGILNQNEIARLLRAIGDVRKRYEKGTLKIGTHFEDVHSAIQEELKRLVGPLAGKIHTGRSRNDLVSQSARLYCRDQSKEIYAKLVALQKVLVSKAEQYQELLLPGMTHLQNAQVLSQAHIFLAYVEMLERAKARLKAAMAFFDVCVLGSGALAGVTFDLDQKKIARDLGLSSVTRNSYDVSGDRDFVVNFLSSMVMIGLEISRIAEDLLIGQTRGFRLVDLDESFCTGSSMMPQKKNADVLELSRGAMGVFMANFMGFLTVVKGLPTSYNRDLQWDKKFLFDSAEVAQKLLLVFTKAVQTMRLNQKSAADALRDETLYATDLADYLVKKGIPFNEAHEITGRIVSFSEKNEVPLSKIGLDLLKGFSPRIDGDVYALFDAAHSVRLKKTQGSTHPARIRQEIGRWKKELKSKGR